MLPRVVLHNAVSVDGRNVGFPVDLGLFYDLASRWHEDVTLVGSETMLAGMGDAPPEEDGEVEPPMRDPGDARPLLAIVDSRGRVRHWQFLRAQPYWRDAIALCSRATPRSYLDYLGRKQVDYIVAGDEHVNLREALAALRDRYGARVVRVDSGGKLNGALLRAGLVDEVSVLVCPSLVGGTTPASIFQAPDFAASEDAIPLRLTHVERLAGDSVWQRYEIVKTP